MIFVVASGGGATNTVIFAAAISGLLGLAAIPLGRFLDRRNIRLDDSTTERMGLLEEARKIRSEIRDELAECRDENRRLSTEARVAQERLVQVETKLDLYESGAAAPPGFKIIKIAPEAH